MKEKLKFIRLPLFLVFLFFVARLALGAAGVSYQAGTQLFSMVTLQAYLALIWAAVGKSRGYGLWGTVQAIVLIVLASQILIFGATAASYWTGAETYFNHPTALNSDGPVEFATAMMARFGGLVANVIGGAIIACLGWALGFLVPSMPKPQPAAPEHVQAGPRAI